MSSSLSEENLILLISQPRAGSTLLQRILAGHPRIHTTAEPWLMLHPVYALRSSGHHAEYGAQMAHRALQDFLGSLEDGEAHYYEALRRMALYLYGASCEGAGRDHFLDKTPRYFLIIPELASVFPSARFVLLLRNPLAVLASILETWIKGEWIRLSRHYQSLVEAPRLLLDGMRLLGERATVVHYEQLVQEPERTIGELCGWLGLDYQAGMVDYGQRGAPPGRYGDPTGVMSHDGPSTASLDRWLELGRGRQTRLLAEGYLGALGPEVLEGIGYSHADLEARLRAVPCTNARPLACVSWGRACQPAPGLLDRLVLIFVEFLQRGRLVHTGRQLAKLLTRPS